MDLLEKFDAVKICVRTRITEADYQFCQQQQAVYQDAVVGFYQIAGLWMDMCVNQKAALLNSGDCIDRWKKKYLESDWWPETDTKSIMKHIFQIHRDFISVIVSYLNTVYYLSLDDDTVADRLLPHEPVFYETEDVVDWSEYPPFVLSYEDVVDLILSGFNGRTFGEQAHYELVESCHRAAWKGDGHTVNFEQQKAVVKFLSGACGYGYHNRCEQWYVRDSMKNVLKGIAYFETGAFGHYPDGLDDLFLEKKRLWNDLWEFEDCKKLERIKMFKNGRMDIRFTSEGYARQFVSKYLGTVA